MVDTTPRSRSRTILAKAPAAIVAGLLAVTSASCGGGGSSGGSAAGTSLAFSVAWEQPVQLGGVSLTSDGAALGFEPEIPPSVNAIRFVLTPPSGEACCIAVVRGSEAFAERRIVLADIVPGEGTLEVNGYPTTFAPSDGVSNTCQTRPPGAGTPCSSQDTLPSFVSGDIEIDIVAGITNVVDVDVHSVPFLLDLDPADEEIAGDNPVEISFTVVDANHDIDPDIEILVDNEGDEAEVNVVSLEPCADGDPELPDCSDGGELEVSGFRVVASVEEDLLTNNELTIRASNTSPTPRSMESVTTFYVTGVTTVTSSTTTTTSSSTSTTTFDTTTTTLDVPPSTFCLAFTVDSSQDLLGVSYNVSYGATGGEFPGEGEDVECFSLIDDNQNTFTTFNDQDGSNVLSSAVISASAFEVPQAIAQCFFQVVPPLNLNLFSIQVTEATAEDLSSVDATVTVTETTCPF